MAARILVVDDVAMERKLMVARLRKAYYSVMAVASGEEAIDLLLRESFDLVVLDVIMPGIGGYETCRRIKSDPATADLPVVLVTSLDQPQDRDAGVEAGADDFLTKPVGNLALMSRLRSLTRMKQASDNLKAKLGALVPASLPAISNPLRSSLRSRVLVVDDAGDRYGLGSAISQSHALFSANSIEATLDAVTVHDVELAVISLPARGFDPLQVVSELRSALATRHVPILVASLEEEEERIWKALDLGATDYVPLPLDRSELLARVGTHVRRLRDDEALQQKIRISADLAFQDPLTALWNRRTMEARLEEFVGAARRGARPFCVLVADLDHFKHVNDAHGHAAGDRVLAEFAVLLRDDIRANDVACRWGGEEFVVLMDDADEEAALFVAERIRRSFAKARFVAGGETFGASVSIGLACFETGDGAADILRRADLALYDAKRAGRNRVITASRLEQP